MGFILRIERCGKRAQLLHMKTVCVDVARLSKDRYDRHFFENFTIDIPLIIPFPTIHPCYVKSPFPQQCLAPSSNSSCAMSSR